MCYHVKLDLSIVVFKHSVTYHYANTKKVYVKIKTTLKTYCFYFLQLHCAQWHLEVKIVLPLCND